MPTLEEVRAFLEQNQGDQAVQEFVRGLNPVTLNSVQDFTLTTEEGKQWLQRQKDSFFSSSLETWKKNNLDDLVLAKAKELNPEETEEQKRIRQLEQKLAEREKESLTEKLRNKGLSYANEKGLPAALVDYFLGEDEDKTVENLAKLEETFKPYVDAQVEQRFKESGRKFNKGSNDEPSTAADLAKQRNEQQQAPQKSAWN